MVNRPIPPVRPHYPVKVMRKIQARQGGSYDDGEGFAIVHPDATSMWWNNKGVAVGKLMEENRRPYSLLQAINLSKVVKKPLMKIGTFNPTKLKKLLKHSKMDSVSIDTGNTVLYYTLDLLYELIFNLPCRHATMYVQVDSHIPLLVLKCAEYIGVLAPRSHYWDAVLIDLSAAFNEYGVLNNSSIINPLV